MKRCCGTCVSYSPEYQGWRTEFINYCVRKKEQIELESSCLKWEAADSKEIEIRKKIWKLWDILERRTKL